jgi:hypothetical protein
MARRELHGRFNQPSHTLRYYHIEMECFVYNWRILLGGAASAAILTVGVAAPAFAQAQDAPVSLSGLNSASGALCGLGSLPVSGEVSAAANVIGASCGTSSSSSSTAGGGMIQANGPMRTSTAASSSKSGSSTGSSTGLGSVTGTLSGVTGGLQNGGSISTPLSGVTGG